MSWLLIKGNLIRMKERVLISDSWDFLFSEYKIKGRNPVIIEGEAVISIKGFLNKAITERKRVVVYNPIIEERVKTKSSPETDK